MKKNQKLSSRRNLLIVITIALGVGAYFGADYWTYAVAQDKDRVLEKGNDFTPPIDISLVKSEIGVIETDKNFIAGENWFKGLELNLRNKSDKSITHISISIRFPRPEGQRKPDFVTSLTYGESPIPSQDGRFHSSTAKPVMPEENIELKLPDDDYNRVRESLKELGYPLSIDKIKIYVTTIGFNDDTVWMADRIYKFDKNNPGKLILLEKKKNQRSPN